MGEGYRGWDVFVGVLAKDEVAFGLRSKRHIVRHEERGWGLSSDRHYPCSLFRTVASNLRVERGRKKELITKRPLARERCVRDAIVA